jgi:hypothetical protein
MLNFDAFYDYQLCFAPDIDFFNIAKTENPNSKNRMQQYMEYQLKQAPPMKIRRIFPFKQSAMCVRVWRPVNNLARDELGALQLYVHLLGPIGDRHHDCRLPVCLYVRLW